MFAVSDTATVGSACAVGVSANFARCTLPGLSTAVKLADSNPMRRTLKTDVPGGRPAMRNSPLSPVIACTLSDLLSVISAPATPTPVLSITCPINVAGTESRLVESASGVCACTGAPAMMTVATRALTMLHPLPKPSFGIAMVVHPMVR